MVGYCSAIMSVVKEAPDTAYVKGGPFSRLGVELPEVAAHVWWSEWPLRGGFEEVERS